MHDRSNGLGGGLPATASTRNTRTSTRFTYSTTRKNAKETCEKELERHFDIVNLSKIPTRQHPRIKDEPMIWRYFVTPLHTKLASSHWMSVSSSPALSSRINHTLDGAYIFSSGKNMGVFKANGFPEDVGEYYRLEEYEGLLVDLPWPLSDQHPGLVGRRASVCAAGHHGRAQRRDLLLRCQTAASLKCSAIPATC